MWLHFTSHTEQVPWQHRRPTMQLQLQANWNISTCWKQLITLFMDPQEINQKSLLCKPTRKNIHLFRFLPPWLNWKICRKKFTKNNQKSCWRYNLTRKTQTTQMQDNWKSLREIYTCLRVTPVQIISCYWHLADTQREKFTVGQMALAELLRLSHPLAEKERKTTNKNLP